MRFIFVFLGHKCSTNCYAKMKCIKLTPTVWWSEIDSEDRGSPALIFKGWFSKNNIIAKTAVCSSFCIACNTKLEKKLEEAYMVDKHGQLFSNTNNSSLMMLSLRCNGCHKLTFVTAVTGSSADEQVPSLLLDGTASFRDSDVPNSARRTIGRSRTMPAIERSSHSRFTKSILERTNSLKII